MTSHCHIVAINLDALETHLQDIIYVRTSAYRQWNGPKSPAECRREAASWRRKITTRRNPAVFVAQKDDEIVGYLWGYERNEGEFHISHTGVRDDLKRQGIGRALLRECQETCRSRGMSILSTATYNRFVGMLILLLQEGFTIQGVTWIEGASEPRLLLRKALA